MSGATNAEIAAEMRRTWPHATLAKCDSLDYGYQCGAMLEVGGRLYIAREIYDYLTPAAMIRALRAEIKAGRWTTREAYSRMVREAIRGAIEEAAAKYAD